MLLAQYRHLTANKFSTLSVLEERLPAFQFRHDWVVYNTNPWHYRPTLQEQLVPILFAIAYLGTFVTVVVV
jgi:hypothetical protein